MYLRNTNDTLIMIQGICDYEYMDLRNNLLNNIPNVRDQKVILNMDLKVILNMIRRKS